MSIIKKIGTFIASRALYFVLGILIAIGSTYVYATWDQARTTANPGELTEANWNEIVNMIESEVANKWKLNGTNVYYNAGNVGIGDTTPDAGLKFDVEGKIGATEYCDENGGSCTVATNLGIGGLNSYVRTCGTDGCTVNCDAGDIRTGCGNSSGGGAHNNNLDYSYPTGTNGCFCKIWVNSGNCYAICLDTN